MMSFVRGSLGVHVARTLCPSYPVTPNLGSRIIILILRRKKNVEKGIKWLHSNFRCHTRVQCQGRIIKFRSIFQGLDNGVTKPTQMTSDLNTPRIDSYRFSMANLEESLDVDLDAILGELCALETKCNEVWFFYLTWKLQFLIFF